MKIVIRDDDLCYYSNFRDFKSIYDKLDVPVSISLIPFAVSDHGNKHPYDYEGGGSKSVELNSDLVSQLKAGIKDKKYEIMLHGFTHEYKCKKGKYIPEMMWRNKKDCDALMKKSIDLYKNIFGIRPKIFISPSDKCRIFLFPLLRKYNFNYCGLINRLSTRPFSIKTIANYVKRQYARVKYGYPFCGVMNYCGWKEIQTYQKIEYDYLVFVFEHCRKMNFPMIIETHYWHLNRNENEFNCLAKFIEYAKNNGGDFSLMSDIFI